MKLEVFLKKGDPDSEELMKMVVSLKDRFKDKLEIFVYEGEEVASEKKLKILPAIVVEDMIKIQGICPSEETILKAFRELGFETVWE